MKKLIIFLANILISFTLMAKAYVLTEMDGKNVEKFDVTIFIECDKISGQSFVNNFFARVNRNDENKISNIASTLMASDEESMTLERIFFDKLRNVKKIKKVNKGLILEINDKDVLKFKRR